MSRNTVALGIRGPAVPEGGAAVNPLEAVGTMARVQNELLTARNMQATFAARQQLGQIYAAYGNDPDQLASQIAQSPASAFFPEAFTQAKNAALLGTQQAGARLEMSGNIMKDWGQSMSLLYANPTMEQWMNLKDAALSKAFDPKVKAATSEQMDALGRAMFTGTGGDAEAVRKNILANYMHFGMTPEQATMLGALPQAMDVGSGTQFITTPGIYGRPVTAASGVIPKGLPPTPITGRTEVMPAQPGGIQFPSGPGTNLAAPQPQPASQAVPNALAPPTSSPASAAPAGASPNALAPAASPTVYGTGLHYGQQREEAMKDYEDALDAKVTTGSSLYKSMDEIVNEAKKVQIGGGTSAYMALGKGLQALGVDNDTVNKWARGDLAAAQVIDKISLQNATAQMRTQLETGRYNRNEFVAYLNSNPNLVTDPHAMLEVFNMWNEYFQRDKAEQNALNTAKGKPGFDINTWPNQWANSDYMKNFATGKPFTGEGVWGVLPPKGPHGAFMPRNPTELKEIWNTPGVPYYQPGDDPTRQGPRFTPGGKPAAAATPTTAPARQAPTPVTPSGTATGPDIPQ